VISQAEGFILEIPTYIHESVKLNLMRLAVTCTLHCAAAAAECERLSLPHRRLQGELEQLRGKEGTLSEVQASLLEALREKDQLKLQLARYYLGIVGGGGV